ncbi:DUF2335 domain-containing protein [Granulicella sp. WH15]|uniref:DUF2335 domain-containing protein n=1 Tax=Granulicella sp. WH15 TaxID=2602070 RepID=UPI0013677300|nr:DUF2335 domain-containing protein [Granulicella sp. WH15]QHN05152.1 DUF2335 domain-containing protein [Granulicella sp. WH15]
MNRRSQQKHTSQLAHHSSAEPGQVDNVNAVSRSVEFVSYSGPLPPPEVLRQFEEIIPGSAERIFSQFEAQSTHRRRMEATAISSGAFSQKLGTISGALIGLLGVGGGVWLSHDGKSLAGLSTLFSTLAVLVGTYLYKRHQQDNERAEKNKPSSPQAK